MEIKVDVHTVHPSSSNPPNRSNTGGTQGPYTSWGTPDSSPAHTVFKKTEPNIESKPDIEDDTEILRWSLVPFNKVRVLDSPHHWTLTTGVQDFVTELEELDYVEVKEDLGKEFERSDAPKTVPVVETPQSPVPSSPSRDEKSKGWNLPRFCDPFVAIDPQGHGYISWLFLVTFCYSYNAWCVPLRATFPYQTPDNSFMWMLADYICDVIYLIDVVFVKPRLMFLNEGFWVNNVAETRGYYKKKLQYKFDIISLLPLEVLYFYFGPEKVILRVPRLLKLQTFWEFHQAVDRILYSPYGVRIGKTLFYIFYLIHLNACSYYAMSSYIGLGSNGWVYDNKGNAYIRCFYFATKTATSIGKNPKPEKTVEFLYMTAAWLMGVFVFALLIGQIRDIIATATRREAEYRKTVDNVTRYLRKLNMPESLQKRVTCWFKYTWSQQRCFDEAKILNSLPFNMKLDVAFEVHMSTLSKVQLFRDCSASLLRDLVLQLRPVSFLPRDVVVRRGDVGHHMYIIKSGECYVMSPDEKEILATLGEGSVFGEISLLGIDGLRRRTATVRSRGYSNLFALSRMDLEAALKHHKEAAQILRLRADQIIRENAARQTRQKLEAEEPPKNEMPTLRRRKSAVSADSSVASEGCRLGSTNTQRRLSAVSENLPRVTFASPSKHLPKIVFSPE